MNVLEGMKNMGETECFFMAKKASLPHEGPSCCPCFCTGHVHFLQAACRQQVVYSKWFFPGSITAEGSCLTPAARLGSG